MLRFRDSADCPVRDVAEKYSYGVYAPTPTCIGPSSSLSRDRRDSGADADTDGPMPFIGFSSSFASALTKLRGFKYLALTCVWPFAVQMGSIPLNLATAK